jgi:hypothetical protein
MAMFLAEKAEIIPVNRQNLAEINAYWARLVFSGKTRPPQVVENADSILRQVASQPGALAYVERSQADPRVKIVFELGD